jgi:hypothetical protein
MSYKEICYIILFNVQTMCEIDIEYASSGGEQASGLGTSCLQVAQFDSKDDLIEAVMASAHVPFFLDGRPFLKYREKLCWDGSFPDFFYFENSQLLRRGDKTLIVDYSMDEELEWTRGDFLRLRDYDEIMALIEKGYQYMRREHEAGTVSSRFDTERYAL